MFILDTNVVSEFRRGPNADRNVMRWAWRVTATEFFISAMSVFEIELGVCLLERRDPKQAAALRTWIDGNVLARFQGRVLPVDALVAARTAPLHVPNPRQQRDAFIAATALVHGMTVVTRNVRDFEGTGVSLLNPWQIAA